MPKQVPIDIDATEWGPFLRDVDRQLDFAVVLHCLGGFVMRVLYEVPRHTGDIDYWEALPAPGRQKLNEIAGPESPLAEKHRVCIHSAGPIDMPENYEDRLIELTCGFRHLRLFVPEVYDLLLSKLTRNSPKDRDDVQHVANRELLDYAQLRTRFQEEMTPVVGDRRQHELTLELWTDLFPAATQNT